MKKHEIRQNRIAELTKRALAGQSLSQLTSRCIEWKISPGTINSYLDEVRERLRKAMMLNGESDK